MSPTTHDSRIEYTREVQPLLLEYSVNHLLMLTSVNLGLILLLHSVAGNVGLVTSCCTVGINISA